MGKLNDMYRLASTWEEGEDDIDTYEGVGEM